MHTIQVPAPQTSADYLAATSSILEELTPAEKMTPNQVRQALGPAKQTHDLVIGWVQTLDLKISQLLTANGALVAGCLAILEQGQLLRNRSATHTLLAITLLPLLYSVLMAISTVSPTLKVARWGANRHLPETPPGKPTSILFFGQIAQHASPESYAQAAKEAFANETVLLDDLLKQTYINAKIAQNKSVHIAHSGRGLFLAVILLFLSALTYAFKF